MSKSIGGRHLLLMGLLLGMFAGQAMVRAEGAGDGTGGRDDLAYRRVFVPADRPEEWPTSGQRYLSIGSDEFEKLVDQALTRRTRATTGATRINRVDLTAALAPQGLLVGDVLLSIEKLDDDPALARLSPLNLNVFDPQWTDGHGSREAPLVGVWMRPGEPSEQFGVLATQSDDLSFHFALPPASRASGEWQYQLELPGADVRRLELLLPANYTASLTSAYLREKVEQPGVTTRWSFQLGPGQGHRLRIRGPAAANAPQLAGRPLAAISEAYQINVGGLNYEAELRIQQRESIAQELAIVLPEEMQMVEALIDRTPVQWRRDTASSPLIHLALPSTTEPFTVAVKGAAPLRLDQAWSLPRISVRDVFWTEGSSTVSVGPLLELQALDVQGGTLVNAVGVGDAADRGEAFRVQSWSEQSALLATLSEQRSQLKGRIGVTAEFSEREATSRCQALVWLENGAAYQLDAALDAGWNIQSIETIPPEDLGEWHVEERDGARRLFIRLRRSPSQAEPVVVKVDAKKPYRALSRTIELSELDWIRFSRLSADRTLWLVKGRRGGELQSDRTLLRGAIDADVLTAEERQLLDRPEEGLLFVADQLDERTVLRMASTPVRYQGEGRIELARTAAGFEHRVAIDCRPTTGALTELRLMASRPWPAGARWTLAGSDERLSVESISGSPRQTGAERTPSSSPSLYRVRLPRPMSEPFQLQATWRGEASPTDSIYGFTLPGADSWQSWAILRGKENDVRIDARECPPAAASPTFADRNDGRDILGCYRLTDDPFALPRATPMMALRQGGVDRRPDQTTCWLLEASTLLFPDGRQMHRLNYSLQPGGTATATLDMPRGLRLRSLYLDDQPAPESYVQRGEQIDVALPEGRQTVSLVVELESPGKPVGRTATVEPTFPSTSFPVLQGVWSVSASSSYAFVQPNETAVSGKWLVRLFGPLVASGDELQTPSGLFAKVHAESESAPGDVRTGPDAAAGRALAPEGWSTVTQSFVGRPTPVNLRHIDATSGRWYGTLALFAVATTWSWPTRKAWVSSAALMAAVSSLILPTGYFQIAQAALLGLLGGMLFSQAGRVISQTSGEGYGLRAALLMIGLLLSDRQAVRAAETPPAPASVLYPVDSEEKQLGTEVLVPEEFMRRLLASTSADSHDGASAVLLDANYRFELEDDAESGEVNCQAAQLTFTWRAFERGVRVALPLRQDEADWDVEASTLNGYPANIAWTDSGCTVTLPETGLQELKLPLTPRRSHASGQSLVRLQVPVCPPARIEVIHPPELALRIKSAAIDSSASDLTHTVARIGSLDAIELAWPAVVDKPDNSLQVEQLSWLHLDSGGAVLEVRLKLSGDAELNDLHLVASPQLKLLPLPPDGPLYELPYSPEMPSAARLRFRTLAELPTTVTVRYQLQRTAALGQVDFPWVRLRGAQTRVQHFAVSTAAGLRIRDQAGAGLATIAAGEIEQRWGGLPNLSAQYAVNGDWAQWSAQVEPALTRASATEQLNLLCTRNEVKVDYTTVTSHLEGSILLQRILIPPSLAIRRVSVATQADSETVPVRWARPQPEQLVVFLGRPISTPHTIRVEGVAPYDENHRLAIKKIAFQSNAGSPVAIQISRASDVLVSVEPAEAVQLPPPDRTGRHAEALVVGALTVGSMKDAEAELVVSPNELDFAVDAVVGLDPSTSDIQATLHLHGTVSRGVVDHLQIVADKSWSAPYVIRGGVLSSVQDIPHDAARQILNIHLPRPVSVGGSIALSITGSQPSQPNQRLQFPSMRLLATNNQRHFIALPATPGNQTADWTLIGVERSTLPEPLAEQAGMAAETPVYLVRRERFVAQRRVFPDTLREPAVRLIESKFILDANGDCSAVVEMIVQPGGLSDWAVALPDGAEAIHLEIDGRPVRRVIAETNLWRPAAGPRYLPRIIRLAYSMPPIDHQGGLRFNNPRVLASGEPLEVRRALWEIVRPPSIVLADELTGGEPFSESAFREATRRESIAAVLDAAPLALQLPGWEAREWFRPWIERLGTIDSNTEDAADDVQESKWSSLQAQLRSSPETALALTPVQAAALPAPLTGAITSWYEGGRGEELTIAVASEPIVSSRWMVAGLILAAWALAWRHPRPWNAILESLGRHAFVVALFLGVAWVALMTPRAVGVLIATLAAAALLKERQQRRRLATHEIPLKETQIDAPSAVS